MNRAAIYELDALTITSDEIAEMLQQAVNKLMTATNLARAVSVNGNQQQARAVFGIIRDVEFTMSVAMQELDNALNQ